jgi:hypothetical protein
MVQFYYA